MFLWLRILSASAKRRDEIRGAYFEVSRIVCTVFGFGGQRLKVRRFCGGECKWLNYTIAEC